MELPTYSKWPPSSSKKFINLAVVRKEKVSKKKADEFTRATIHGTEIDDIYRKKEAVDFSRVGKMKDGSLAKLILVEGAPGIGKTTFAWEVCRKWASGEILQDYGLVVLLRLRDKRVREAKTVFDLFYHAKPELSRAVGTEILDHEGESVLLLYEGYDELPRELQKQQSIFWDILRKNNLPRATILITSRPSATEYLCWEIKKQISQHIEILGFTKDDITTYVQDVIEDEQVCRDFFQYLKCYPYIHGMMYVPLNAVIVTEVYKSSQQSPEKFIPTTMTELYTALTRSLLLRYLCSHSEYGLKEWNLKCFSDLPKELYQQFCEVTAVALKGMIEDTFMFDDLPNDFNTLDLMQSVSELYVAQGASVSYNFFHLTLQEYLAAVNISQQPVEKQIEFFQTTTEHEYYLPFSPSPEDGTRNDQSSILEMPQPLVGHAMTHSRQPHSNTSHHQNLSSSQPPSTSLTPPQRSKLNPHAKPFIPHQFSSPGDSPLLSAPTQNTITLLHSPTVAPSNSQPSLATVPQPRDLPTLPLEQPHAQPLVPHHSFTTAQYSSNNTHTGDLKGGCTHHDTHSTLPLGIMDPESSVPTSAARLGTTHDSFESEDGSSPIPNTTTVPQLSFRALSTQLSRPDITVPVGLSMRLRNVLRFVAGLTKFKDIPLASLEPLVLKSLPHVKYLTFKSLHWLFESQCSDTYNNLVNPYHLLTKHRSSLLPFDFFVLGYAMAHITTHWKINLRNREIGDDEIEMLVAGVNFKRNHFTQSEENQQLYVDISSNFIGHGGATALAEMLKENMTLQTLYISQNPIGVEGAIALAEMLKKNRTIQQLNVSCDSIGDRGATALAEMLKENRALQQLNISSNSIGDTGATALAEVLKENRTLQQLNVSRNSIGDGGATALAEMLKENRTLQQLDVRNNSMGDGGATALEEVQKQNKIVSIITGH